jgi:ectoine hydroxylase-related dioxygenase (phytanoyl-CoA dioxygenase family)
MDQAFLPKHYEGAPRSMYYHCMLALSPVLSGGAPFLAVPGSYQHALSLTGALSAEEQRAFEADYSTHADASGAKLYNAIATEPHVEVLLDEGDLLVQDPMLMHSASSNAGAIPSRYTLFTTMFHPIAMESTVVASPQASRAPCSKFPREMHEALAPEWRGLLDWVRAYSTKHKTACCTRPGYNINV